MSVGVASQISEHQYMTSSLKLLSRREIREREMKELIQRENTCIMS